MTDPHFKKQALLNLLHPLPSSPTFNFLSSCFLVELAVLRPSPFTLNAICHHPAECLSPTTLTIPYRFIDAFMVWQTGREPPG